MKQRQQLRTLISGPSLLHSAFGSRSKNRTILKYIPPLNYNVRMRGTLHGCIHINRI